MGVQGLWTLLEPVGRRVNIEAIQNKRLAVDASIWLFQFMRAMRDDKGEMIKNAHLKGFFSRICRLLFHKVHPVFVFDGATPALKRSTHIARRRRREAQEVVLKKTAEKLLFNQLKKQALEAARASKSGNKVRRKRTKGLSTAAEAAAASDDDDSDGDAAVAVLNATKNKSSVKSAGDKLISGVPEPISGVSINKHTDQALTSCSAAVNSDQAGPSGERLPACNDQAGPSSEERAPAYINQAGTSGKWVSAANDQAGPSGERPLPSTSLAESHSIALWGTHEQVCLDEELAYQLEQEWLLDEEQGFKPDDTSHKHRRRSEASDQHGVQISIHDDFVSEEDNLAIAAALQEDHDHDTGLAVVSARTVAVQETPQPDPGARSGKTDHHGDKGGAKKQKHDTDEEEEEEEEEGEEEEEDGTDLSLQTMLPTDLSSLDAEVLSTLPQSLQLEILEKMRDAQAAANREKFQEAAAAAPESFSSVQLNTYLKASAFRQKIEGYKRKIGGAADRGADGTSDMSRRLASDESREFVFRRDGQPAKQQSSSSTANKGLQRQRGGLSAANARALAAPVKEHPRMAPLSTKVALASFEGTHQGVALASFEGTHQGVALASFEGTHQGVALASFEGTHQGVALASFESTHQGVEGQQLLHHASMTPHFVAGKWEEHKEELGQNESLIGIVLEGVVVDVDVSRDIADKACASDHDNMFEDDYEDSVVLVEEPGNSVSKQGSKQGVITIHTQEQQTRRADMHSKLVDSLDDLEWEDVEHEDNSSDPIHGRIASLDKRPADWKERMAARQRFWSSSHGFKLGRKLGEWEATAGSSSKQQPSSTEGGGPASHSLTDPQPLSIIKPHYTSPSLLSNTILAPPSSPETRKTGSEEEEEALQHAIVLSLIEEGTCHIGGGVKTGTSLSTRHIPVADEDREEIEKRSADVQDELNVEYPILQQAITSSTLVNSHAMGNSHAMVNSHAMDAAFPSILEEINKKAEESRRSLCSTAIVLSDDELLEWETYPTSVPPPQSHGSLHPDSTGRVEEGVQRSRGTRHSLISNINQQSQVLLEARTAACQPKLPPPPAGAHQLHETLSPLGCNTAEIPEIALPADALGSFDFVNEVPALKPMPQTMSSRLKDSTPEILVSNQYAAVQAAHSPSALALHMLSSRARAADQPPKTAPHGLKPVSRNTDATQPDPVVLQALPARDMQDGCSHHDAKVTATSIKTVGKPSTDISASNVSHNAASISATSHPSAASSPYLPAPAAASTSCPAAPSNVPTAAALEAAAIKAAAPPAVVNKLKVPFWVRPEDIPDDPEPEDEWEQEGLLQPRNMEIDLRPEPSENTLPQQSAQSLIMHSSQNVIRREFSASRMPGQDAQGRGMFEPQDSLNTKDEDGAAPAQEALLRPPVPLDTPVLLDIDSELRAVEEEGASLRREHARAARSTEVPTSEMYAECQELLQIFGLPFIVAPVEAEAQCSWLDREGLVDGVVTDDNDAFLFGSTHVYRHIFDDKRYVEEYRMSDIERELGLSRERLVELAMLLGSDYTEGVAGIGIVNALEVIQAFSSGAGPLASDDNLVMGTALRAFKMWMESPDEGLLAAAAEVAGQLDASTAVNEEAAGNADERSTSGKQFENAAFKEFKKNHRNIRKTWQLPSGFPSDIIMEAYREPHVDRNKSKFTFGRPDMQLLNKFCRDKFGWTDSKVDELMSPVLQAYGQRQTQLTMDQFLSFNQRFAKIKSKRLQKAVMKITGGAANPELMMAEDLLQASPGEDQKGTSKKRKDKGLEDSSEQAKGKKSKGRPKGKKTASKDNAD